MTTPAFGTRRVGSNGKIEVYGPDPWAYIYNFPCWFSLDAYVKDFGEEPPTAK
jgi:hypothetical protein